VKLTISHLLLRLRINGAIPLHPLIAFMPWAGKPLPLSFLVYLLFNGARGGAVS